MTNYFQYHFQCSPEVAEILPAFLGELPFEIFEDAPDGLLGYMPETVDLQHVESEIGELASQFTFTFSRELIPGQNWNELWESNFQPVVVGDFCAVRADFHEPFGDKVKHELVINPKMAFGTGHHETTWMCLAALEKLPLAGAKLFDYGCGTGILGILASRLGAGEIEAVDIEQESFLNTVENCEVNGIHNLTVRCGTLAEVQGNDFDGILANINRNVILDSLPRLAALTKAGGWLLVSGILREDEGVVVAAAEAVGFVKLELWARGNWLCIHFEKPAG